MSAMPLPIEDYAIIGDCHTAALVGRDGSIDWLCLPRFDSASTFGALLGDEDHGRWLLAPNDESATAVRRYRDSTLILETEWTTPTGSVLVTDFMPIGNRRGDIVRRVAGIQGTVTMRQDVRIRFDYARAIPWIRQVGSGPTHAIVAVAGPDAVILRGPHLHPADHSHQGEFTVAADDVVDISMTWYPSHRDWPDPIDVGRALERTAAWWSGWAGTLTHDGPHREEVLRSLMLLRALTHEDTGGIVAAATTSLPEQAGGTRNWDYRYVWLRDASLALTVLLSHGSTGEAMRWGGWLLRAIAGDPSEVQIMYGVAGERDLAERELSSLPGYLGASPVRIGNGAFSQFQADVIGEVMIALHAAREAGVVETDYSWALQRALLGFTVEPPRGEGQRHLGDARRSAVLRALPSHGVGSVRPWRQGGGGLRARRRQRPVAPDARQDRRGDRGRRLRRRSRQLRPALRLDARRRIPAAARADRIRRLG